MRIWIMAAIIITCAFGYLQAAEYFVAKNGNNSNDGLKEVNAFKTIQQGVNALKPGDTLTICPGEYFETIRREGVGNMKATTTLRAKPPGTVLIRGDIIAPTFKAVKGYRFVYSASR